MRWSARTRSLQEPRHREALLGPATASREVERSPVRPYLDMVGHGVDRNASFRLVPGNPRPRLESRQDDAKIIVLDQCSRVLATGPAGFAMELIDFSRQIELE